MVAAVDNSVGQAGLQPQRLDRALTPGGPQSTAPLSEHESLQLRADLGLPLTPVEQGMLARLNDRAAAGGAAATHAKQAAAAPKTVKGAKTAADFKLTNANKQDTADLNAALAYLQGADAKGKANSPTAVALLAKVPKGTKINIIHDGNDSYDPSTKTINWDPRSGLAVSSGKGNQSAALGLAHEIDHMVGGQKNPKPTGDAYDNTEEKRVITGSETKIAKELGEPTRNDHRGTAVTLKSSTAHTAIKR
jgi:hypothetical protein